MYQLEDLQIDVMFQQGVFQYHDTLLVDNDGTQANSHHDHDFHNDYQKKDHLNNPDDIFDLDNLDDYKDD